MRFPRWHLPQYLDKNYPNYFKDNEELVRAIKNNIFPNHQACLWFLLFIRPQHNTVGCLQYDAVYCEFRKDVWTVPWENIMWLLNSNKERWQAQGGKKGLCLPTRWVRAYPLRYHLPIHAPFRLVSKKWVTSSLQLETMTLERKTESWHNFLFYLPT